MQTTLAKNVRDKSGSPRSIKKPLCANSRARQADLEVAQKRSKAYREERITALLKSWSDLNQMDVAQIFRAVAPFGVLGVGERDAFGVAQVPGVFGGLDFLARGFLGERRQWRAWVHL